MKRKLFLLLMTVIFSALFLIACGQETSQDTSNEKDKVAENEEETNSTGTTYPLEIEINDDEGNQFTQTFEKVPERVVTNNLSSIEMLLELGLEDKIVGILNPDNKVTGEFADTIAGLNNLGDKMTVSREIIVGQEPDLAIGRSMMFTDETMGSIPTLNDLGINVYTQTASHISQNPKLTAVIDDVLTVGKIFDVNERAEEFAAELQARYDSVVEKVNANKQDEKLNVLAMVRFDSRTGNYMAFNISQGLQKDLLTTLNLEPAVDGSGDNSNLETLISTNPDIILYINADRNAEFDETAIEGLYNEPLIKDVSAIKEKRVYETTYDDLMDYGVRIFDSLEVLANGLYGQ